METFLLDKESKAILEIIACLEKSPMKEVSFSDIQKELRLSIQTIKAYIDTLLTYYSDHHLETFTLHNNYLRMTEQTSFNIFEIYHYLIQKSIKYQLVMAIFKDKTITTSDLYHHLAISKSTAVNYIRQLNQTFKPYHCKINLSSKKIIQGAEHQIRFLYDNLFYGLNQEEIIPDTPMFNAALQQLLIAMPHMTNAVLSRIRLCFYIFQVRTQSSYFINNGNDFKVEDMPFLSYDDFFDKLNTLDFFKDCPDLKTKQQESRYLYFSFCRINLLTLDDIDSIICQTAPTVSSEIQYLVSQFQNQIKFKLSQNELLFLHYNLTLLNQEAHIFKGRSKIFDATETIQKLTANNSNTMAFLNQFISDSCQGNQTIRKSIQNFPTLYYDYAILFKILVERNRPPLKLLVQHSFSPLYRQIIVDKVTNIVSYSVEIYTSEQMGNEKPDGIISNFIPEKKYPNVPFFSISLFYSDWNYTDLILFLNYLADSQNTSFYS